MADTKPLNQMYYEEVEALKAKGIANADAVREVAKKHGKNENAVRGGIFQYRKRSVEGGAPSTARRTRRTAKLSVEDYVANARQALEAARTLIDSEVEQATADRDAAQTRLDAVLAAVKERKADIDKKLRALS